MTYPPPFAGDLAVAPGRPPRPWSVSLAVAFALAMTGGLALSAADGIEEWLRMPGLITEAASATGAPADEVEAERAVLTVLYPVILLIHAVLAAGFAGLSLPVWRGRNGARIALCIVAGLSALCCGGLVGLWALLPDSLDESLFTAELDRLEQATAPLWTEVTEIVSTVLLVVAPIGTLIMLLLPPSNRFFSKPASTDPAGGYGLYPGYHYYGSPYPPVPGPRG